VNLYTKKGGWCKVGVETELSNFGVTKTWNAPWIGITCNLYVNETF